MIIPDTKVPSLDLPLTIGARYVLADQTPEHFTMLVFYRGKHCPICRTQLEDIAQKMEKITAAGINPVAISMDTQERAQIVHDEWATGDLPLAYGLTEDQARAWGLYISAKREGSEEPEVFSEPGLFLVRPDEKLYFAATQNAPFSRPPIDQILSGVKYIVENDYPTRGTMT